MTAILLLLVLVQAGQSWQHALSHLCAPKMAHRKGGTLLDVGCGFRQAALKTGFAGACECELQVPDNQVQRGVCNEDPRKRYCDNTVQLLKHDPHLSLIVYFPTSSRSQSRCRLNNLDAISYHQNLQRGLCSRQKPPAIFFCQRY